MKSKETAANAPTLLCVGSGVAQRYRADTLRALALPSGSIIQFRYGERLVNPELKAHLTSEDRTRTVVLGHVDCTEPLGVEPSSCRVVPYRQAELLTSRAVGSFLVLRLRLGSYRLAGDVNALQTKLGRDGPRWETRNGKRQLAGLWCQELPTVLAATRETDDFADKEVIVKQLKALPDFHVHPFFHFIEGIFEGGAQEGAAVPVIAGEFQLRAGKDYELRVVHIDPSGASNEEASNSLTVQLSSPSLIARTTTTFHVDSPYDVHTLAFATADAAIRQRGSILLSHQAATVSTAGHSSTKYDSEASSHIPEIHLPAAINVNRWSTARRIVLLGALLSSTQLPALYQKKEGWPLGLVLVAAVLGLLTSAFVVLKLKNPLSG